MELKELKWQEDLCRRAEAQKYLDFYNNDHNAKFYDGNYRVKINDKYVSTPGNFGHIERIIRARINQEEADLLCEYIDTTNMTERFINDISLLFRAPVSIEGVDFSAGQQENLEKLLADTMFNAIMREVNKLVNLQFDIHVIPQYRNNEICLDIITSNNMFVWQDDEDPTIATAIFYQVGIIENTPEVGRVDTYHYWDESGKYECHVLANGNISDVIQLEDNPFGKIPIACFRNYIPISTYWHPGKNYIVESNEQIDVRKTVLNMMTDYDLPQKVRIGVDDDYVGKTGLTFIEQIKRNDNGDAVGSIGYIKPDSPLQEHKDLINEDIQQVGNSYGLSTETITGGQFTSGYHLKLSKSEILEKNKQERELYRKPIKFLLSLMCQLSENIGMNFPDNPDFIINFGETKFLESDEEKENARSAKILNGTWSAVQSIMEDNPELTEKEAIERVQKIKERNSITKPANPFEVEEDDDSREIE